MYRVAYRPVVFDDVAGIPVNLFSRLEKAIALRLTTAPEKYGERLRKGLTGLWRLRVGDYRVAYVLDEKNKLVTVWGILHRKEIYPSLEKRWTRH